MTTEVTPSDRPPWDAASIEPKVTTLADALADVPEGTIVMSSRAAAAAGTVGCDGRGFPALWLIFADPDERMAYMLRYLRTWIVTADLCACLDYWADWSDSQGYGLEMTTFRVEDIGRDRQARVPARPVGVR